MTYDWSIDILRDHLYQSVKSKDIVDQILPFHDKDIWSFNTTLFDEGEIDSKFSQFFEDNLNLNNKDQNSDTKSRKSLDISDKITKVINDKRLKHQGTSSSWVISGDYTRHGKPIFVANFHFDLGIPSTLHLTELYYPVAEKSEKGYQNNTNFIIGA